MAVRVERESLSISNEECLRGSNEACLRGSNEACLSVSKGEHLRGDTKGGTPFDIVSSNSIIGESKGESPLIRQYTTQLINLLPQGKAWQVENGTVLHTLLQAMASELARSHIRFTTLMQEILPRDTQELLSEWEQLAGLPDKCTAIGETLEERRKNVLFKLIGITGGSKKDFLQLFQVLGIQATITELRPFICGRAVLGQSILNGEAKNRFYFFVKILEKRVQWLRCGVFELGNKAFATIRYLKEFECLIQRYKPAHTIVIFSYG